MSQAVEEPLQSYLSVGGQDWPRFTETQRCPESPCPPRRFGPEECRAVDLAPGWLQELPEGSRCQRLAAGLDNNSFLQLSHAKSFKQFAKVSGVLHNLLYNNPSNSRILIGSRL